MKPKAANASQEAKNLINQLSILLRNCYVYEFSNTVLMNNVHSFVCDVKDAMHNEENLKVEIINDHFCMNDDRVKFFGDLQANVDYLLKEFRKSDLGSLTFSTNINYEDVKFFLARFVEAKDAQDPFDALGESLRDIRTIQIGRYRKVAEYDEISDEYLEKRRKVKAAYFNAVSMTKGVMNKLRQKEKVSVKSAKRTVEQMVDMVLSDEPLLVGMTSIKDYDEYTYHHSVNVSILSIALGQKLGLERKDLVEMGLAALFHDMGKVEVPNEVLNKSEKFTDEEWKQIKNHPVDGARAVLGLKNLDSTLIRTALVAYQHHQNLDNTGYPHLQTPQDIDFFSQIVAIIDKYDAMTATRVYRKEAMKPDEALRVLMRESGDKMNKVLYKYFVNMIGVYPVGSVVVLSTRELGVVVESNKVFSDRPKVHVLIDSFGKKAEGMWVNLEDKDSSGRYIRSIVKTVDPNKYNIDVTKTFL